MHTLAGFAKVNDMAQIALQEYFKEILFSILAYKTIHFNNLAQGFDNPRQDAYKILQYKGFIEKDIQDMPFITEKCLTALKNFPATSRFNYSDNNIPMAATTYKVKETTLV